MSTAGDFSVVVSEPAGAAHLLVAVHGDLDYAHHAELETVFEHRLPGLGEGARVVVDLSAVTYCDSCGLRTLLGASQAVTARRGELVLRGVSGQPRRALRLTGLDAVLPDADPAADTVSHDEDART